MATAEIAQLLREVEVFSPELFIAFREFKSELLASEDVGFDNESAWWWHVEVRFVLRSFAHRLQDSIESVALRAESLSTGVGGTAGNGAENVSCRGTEHLERFRLLSELVEAFERVTPRRLEACDRLPKSVLVEKRYGLSVSEAEMLRLLVIEDSARSRTLRNYFAKNDDHLTMVCGLCAVTKLDTINFMQEKRQHITEGIVVIKDSAYGDNREPSMSVESIHALLGRELTVEQRLKLSSTVIEAVLDSDGAIGGTAKAAAATTTVTTIGSAEVSTRVGSDEGGDTSGNGSAGATSVNGQGGSGGCPLYTENIVESAVAARATEDADLCEEASVAAEAAAYGGTLAEDEVEDDLEVLTKPYTESLDYLNDQFGLLECEIRIAEHRRQATKEDAGLEEPSFMRAKKVNVFEYEAKRKLALARINHRLALTREAGLEVPRLEALIQLKKLDVFEKSVVVMLIGQTLSPKIQATLCVGERRFCRDAPLQVKVILETFCRDFKEEVQKRVYFYKSSRLSSSGMIRISGPARSADLVNHSVYIDRRILDYVVGLDTEINEVVEGSNLYTPTATLEQLVLSDDIKQSILTLVCNFDKFHTYRKTSGLDDAIVHRTGLVLMFCGPSGTGKTLMVNALAAHLEKRVLLVNFKTLHENRSSEGSDDDGSSLLKLFREAEMADAVLFFDECESMFSQRGSGGSAELSALLTAMERYEGVIFLATNRPFDLDEAMYRRITSVFNFSKPDHTQRLLIWRLYTEKGVPIVPEINWEMIAGKYALTGGYIKNAIVSALLLAIARDSENPLMTEEDIMEGCSMQVRGSLQMQSFAKRVVPRMGLEALELTPALREQLLEVVAFEKARPLLLASWGFGGDAASKGPGADIDTTQRQTTTALFWGAAGTGRSAAAEALGFAFGKALKLVNFSEIAVEVKAGQRVGQVAPLEVTFEEARLADAALVFEGIRAEALCGSDNVSQQLAFHIERFSGVVLLLVTSTEMFRQQLLPPELSRLIKFFIVFDRPASEQRARIWRSALPDKTPVADNIDFDELGRRFEISADGIASAAFRAAATAVLREGSARRVSVDDLMRAGEIEARSAEASDGRLSLRTSIGEHLRKHHYAEYSSFHGIYVMHEERDGQLWKSCEKVCWRLKVIELDTLFIPIVTLDGIEGCYPEMFDAHPKDRGFCFTLAANGQDVLLIEAQERLSDTDLQSSMYSVTSGGMRHGHIVRLVPVAQDCQRELLVDMTEWLKMFSAYFKGESAHTYLLETRAFSDNFLFRFSTQSKCDAPLKRQSEGLTVYFTVAFVKLPKEPMVPRPADPRVGYFMTPVLVGGPRQATTVQYVANRWNLDRCKFLVYVIDASVPDVYHSTIKQGVMAWNAAFEACGLCNIMRCVAPGDLDYPTEYVQGDGRHIAISMTNPSTRGLLGCGPSAVDYRSGEILMASVMLGLKSHVESASRYSEDLLVRPTSAQKGCQRLLDGDDPDVVKHLLFTVIHEVGHTLGLRHNFIAAEDGHSSVMDYADDLDTSDPGLPVFGGKFLSSPGRYDVYAITYGYTKLDGEVRGGRHHGLDLLANGQPLSDITVSSESRNPLFASDEDLDGVDPRVRQHSACVERMGTDKVAWALVRRRKLLECVRAGQIDCNLYSQLVLAALGVVTHAVEGAAGFVGGALVDARRDCAIPCEASAGTRFVDVLLDVLVGPLFRFDAEEVRHLLRRQDGSYGLRSANVLELHSKCCQSLLSLLLSPDALAQLEAQRTLCTDNGSRPSSAYELLAALAFGVNHSGDCATQTRGLFHPLRAGQRLLSTHCADLDASAADPLSTQARLSAARLVNGLVRKRNVHAVVQAHAWALVQAVEHAAEGLDMFEHLSPVTRAHWKLVLETLKDKREASREAEEEEQEVKVSLLH